MHAGLGYTVRYVLLEENKESFGVICQFWIIVALHPQVEMLIHGFLSAL